MTGNHPESASHSKYDAVVFDVGYTLVYFEPPQGTIVRHVLLDLGAERTADEIKAAERAVWRAYYQDATTTTYPATEEYDRETQSRLVGQLLANLGLASNTAATERYIESIETWFSRPGVIRPYPEVTDVLKALKERSLRLAIVSNWSWNLRERVSQAGLSSHFEVIWASAYAGCSKPHPGIFHQALERMAAPQILPERALYVGDSYKHDVIGARNAGMDVVLLDREGDAKECDCTTISDLWGILRLLEP